ncbi:hypothetical protein ASZ90_018391 [hydrocarbon metagenome]|uniref:ABC transporter domain-containing protein n=1 Tax=hydrocarbon metagenome TaxID=938273 RepID=A0A0W8E6B9_9ZZZZ
MPIKAENVDYTYQAQAVYTRQALEKITFHIDDGEIVGIIGRAGAGKTTLLKLLNGLLKPDAGKIFIDEIDGSALKKNSPLLIKKAALVWQFPEQQLFETTVYKELAFGLKSQHLDPAEEKKRIQEAMEQVGLDYERFNERQPSTLSSGEKRRLSIACFLVLKPRYLLMDESLAGLDASGTERLMELLTRLNCKDGVGIIITGHNLGQLSRFCNRIMMLEEGRLLIDTPTIALADYYDQLTERGFTLPVHQEVLYHLKSRGWDIDTRVHDAEEAVLRIMSSLIIPGGKV